MSGAVKLVLTCEPSSVTVSPCPSGTAPSVTSAYLLDASTQAQVDAALSPIDYAQSGAFWSIAFVTVIGIWSLARFFGISRRVIR